jgi:hypothetical protein
MKKRFTGLPQPSMIQRQDHSVISGHSLRYNSNGRIRVYSGHRTTDWRTQKNPARGRAFGFLGSGGRIAFGASRLS